MNIKHFKIINYFLYAFMIISASICTYKHEVALAFQTLVTLLFMRLWHVEVLKNIKKSKVR